MVGILIAYYSRKGENYWDGQIVSLAKGNTEVIAEMIQKVIGGDLFEIDTAAPYPADYTACTETAQEELRKNARPELKNYLESLDGYDTIFVGFPKMACVPQFDTMHPSVSLGANFNDRNETIPI